MQFNQYTASTTSLIKGVGSSLTEMYIPLWVYSSGNCATGMTSANQSLLQKGSNSAATSSGQPYCQLHKLNSNWASSQKFAFEVSTWISNGSGTAYVALWDSTSQTIVSASQVSTTATTATVIRSGQFTLTPGHQYDVTFWCTNPANSAVSKAHLIAFLS